VAKYVAVTDAAFTSRLLETGLSRRVVAIWQLARSQPSRLRDMSDVRTVRCESCETLSVSTQPAGGSGEADNDAPQRDRVSSKAEPVSSTCRLHNEKSSGSFGSHGGSGGMMIDSGISDGVRGMSSGDATGVVGSGPVTAPLKVASTGSRRFRVRRLRVGGTAGRSLGTDEQQPMR